jgi:hypothetical protein
MWLLDQYLRYPILSDLCMATMLLLLNYTLNKNNIQIVSYDKESIDDLLNELISTSMSLGGFVLAAMAIIASSKDSATKVNNLKEAKTGKEFFYNSPAYNILINSYSWACTVYGGVFLVFSLLRTTSESLSPIMLFNLTYFGLLVALFTLFRCIYLIQAVVKIK